MDGDANDYTTAPNKNFLEVSLKTNVDENLEISSFKYKQQTAADDSIKIKKPNSFKCEAKSLIVHWIRNSSSHCMPKIIESRSWVTRIVWMLICLTCFAYCAKITMNSILNYYKFKTTTYIEYVKETPSFFPAVTFCNLNSFIECNINTDRCRSNPYLRTVIEQFDDKCNNRTAYLTDREWYDCLNAQDQAETQRILQKTKRLLANENITSNVRRTFMYDFWDMVLDCEFNGIPCDNQKNVKLMLRNFTEFYNNEYGFCYTFNDGKAGSILKTSESGPEHGLKMTLSVSMSLTLCLGSFNAVSASTFPKNFSKKLKFGIFQHKPSGSEKSSLRSRRGYCTHS